MLSLGRELLRLPSPRQRRSHLQPPSKLQEKEPREGLLRDEQREQETPLKRQGETASGKKRMQNQEEKAQLARQGKKLRLLLSLGRNMKGEVVPALGTTS